MHERLYDKLDKIIEDMEQKDKLSASDLQIIDWATHAQKSMLCTEDMGGYSGRGRRRDSMGRYSRNRSYEQSRDEFADHMRSMMESAPDERSRAAMRKMLREIDE